MSLQALMHMTATHCCLCRTPLTDAQSIEMGIGPVCSRRYYKCEPPTETSLAYAMGALYKAGIPQEVKDAFFEAAKDCKNAQAVRKGVNVLMYWASSVYQDIPKVLSLVPIVQGLGYWNLGAKLAADRTQAVVEECPEHPGFIRVWMKWRFYRHFKGMVARFLVVQAPQKPLAGDRAFDYGVKCSERYQKLGGKVGALFRKEDEDLLHKGLSAVFYWDRILWHGTLEVPTRVPYRVWTQALEEYTPVSHDGLKYSIYLRKTMGPFAALGRNAEGPFGPETLMITTRYNNHQFQTELCQQIPLGDLRWGRISHAWLVKPEHLRTVLKLMVKHFPPHSTQVIDLD